VRLLVGDFLVIREFLVLRYKSFDTLTESPHSGKSITKFISLYNMMFGVVDVTVLII